MTGQQTISIIPCVLNTPIHGDRQNSPIDLGRLIDWGFIDWCEQIHLTSPDEVDVVLLSTVTLQSVEV